MSVATAPDVLIAERTRVARGRPAARGAEEARARLTAHHLAKH
ncbi:MAG TPA: hypothetical protein VFY87_07660 [Geminicoccaceae bacterium]|nr:hypothetical protein [Geminicoccaceae bacterium]